MGSWSEHFTKDGRPYYYNRVTKQSLWEKPKDFEAESTSPVHDIKVAADSKSTKAEYDWEELWDPKTERFYYYNRKERKSVWEKPQHVDYKACTNHTKSTKEKPENQENGSHPENKKEEPDAMKEARKVTNQLDELISRTNREILVKRKKCVVKDTDSKKKTRGNDEKPLIICDEKEKSGNMMTSSLEQGDTEAGKEATRLLQQLSKPDAIMDSSLMLTINAFLRTYKESNGPEILVEKLSSSYRGHAQMIGLVATWLDWLMVVTNASNFSLTIDSNETIKREAEEPTWIYAEDVLYMRLEDLIMQNYNPNMVSDVLSGSTTEPEWLTAMLKDKKWRRMLVKLAEAHKTCTLLQYAIRRISEAGYHQEVASLPTANAFFPVFNGVLIDSLKRISTDSEEEMAKNITNLQRICCQSEYSYFYAEELLSHLDDKLFQLQMHPGCKNAAFIDHVRIRLHRMGYEIQNAATNKVGAKIEPFYPLRRRYIYDRHTLFCDAVLSIFKTKKCSEQAAQALVEQYKGSNPPPAIHLRTPVLYGLIDPLFNPSTSATTPFKQNCITLLAYVASVRDNRSVLSPCQDGDRQEKNLVGQIGEDEMENIACVLADASAICKSDKTLGYNMNQSGIVQRLISMIETPVVSIGVLYWLEMILESSSFVGSTLLHICFPSLLQILKASIRLHKLHWAIALRILITFLTLETENDPVKILELRRESLRCMVFMITAGYVFPVLDFITKNVLELDQALLRHFVTVLLSSIAPPYSTRFLSALSSIIIHPKVQSAIASGSDDCKARLRAFALYCEARGNCLPEQLHSSPASQDWEE
uniref:Negative elongation factor putative n=1 Tax=Albugo laibachii Nc14 TaxID=890382 RepID=F0VZ36_9STRA|nr:negative elongation factor putative [Albugo laibachii Nc14]|eukprot:CCA14051.1 negative elongation factor putative [Albugo laibachii Nc14]